MKVLIVTYHFPPDGAIGGVRPYRLARHLPESGLEPWVLTVQPRFAEQLNHDQRVIGVPEEHILRSALETTLRDRVLRLWRSASTLSLPERPSSPAAGMRRRRFVAAREWAGSWLSFPDRQIGWLRPAVNQADELLRSVKFDVLLSTSPPRVAALIARELSRRHGIPWVMDLRDPWLLNFEGSGTASWTIRTRLALLFRRCVDSAQVVVHNNERLRQSTCLQVRSSGSKTFCIPNGYEPEWADLPSEADREVFRIGYYGNIVGTRSGSTFLEGLSRWLRSREHARGVAARIVGPGYEAVGMAARQLGLGDTVDVRAPLPRAQIRRLVAEDYVLVVLANDQPLQVPGKCYDYLATGRRILAVTERDGATADLFAPLASCKVAETPDEVAAALASFHRDFREGVSAYVARREWLSEAEYPKRVSRYAELLRYAVTEAARIRDGAPPDRARAATAT
jgi:hypothetical protein